jgi:peroxiredoxin Q/BCP
MAQLRQEYEEFVGRQTLVVVVGPENASAFGRYWADHQLPFIGLPDPQHRVLKLYGQEIKLFRFGRMPAQVLVDKAGTARFVHYGHDMSDIPTNAELFQEIDALGEDKRVNGRPGEQSDGRTIRQEERYGGVRDRQRAHHR